MVTYRGSLTTNPDGEEMPIGEFMELFRHDNQGLSPPVVVHCSHADIKLGLVYSRPADYDTQ